MLLSLSTRGKRYGVQCTLYTVHGAHADKRITTKIARTHITAKQTNKQITSLETRWLPSSNKIIN